MTGYGTAEVETRAGWLRAELKTVNHRYFSASLRLPPALERHESNLRDWIREILPRGHIHLGLRVDRAGIDGMPSRLRLNEARVREYLAAFGSLKERFGLAGEVDVALLSRYGDLFLEDDDEAVEIEIDELRLVAQAAAREALRMREQEGERLHDDLEGRLAAIDQALAEIEARAPARLVAERDRLRRAIAELAGNVPVDEERLAREIAFLAERWDISEELVRLRAHIALFRDVLGSDGAEPVGKRLGFLNQEMHRETNTIGSKANDAAIEHLVVTMKNEIERLREQIENVE